VPLDVETMLRIHFLQHRFELSDPSAEDATCDSEPVRRRAGIELGEDRVPGDGSILRFRNLIEEHGLATSIFPEVGAPPGRERVDPEAGRLRGWEDPFRAERGEDP